MTTQCPAQQPFDRLRVPSEVEGELSACGGQAVLQTVVSAATTVERERPREPPACLAIYSAAAVIVDAAAPAWYGAAGCRA